MRVESRRESGDVISSPVGFKVENEVNNTYETTLTVGRLFQMISVVQIDVR